MRNLKENSHPHRDIQIDSTNFRATNLHWYFTQNMQLFEDPTIIQWWNCQKKTFVALAKNIAKTKHIQASRCLLHLTWSSTSNQHCPLGQGSHIVTLEASCFVLSWTSSQLNRGKRVCSVQTPKPWLVGGKKHIPKLVVNQPTIYRGTINMFKHPKRRPVYLDGYSRFNH